MPNAVFYVGDRTGPQGGVAITSNGSNADFVVVANRLPVDADRQPDGTIRWKQAPGGLVTALDPILRSRNGAWVGWPGAAAESSDAPHEPLDSGEGITLVPVQLSEKEVSQYYEGFSNGALWPLYHDVIVKPEYHREWWNAYVEVNRKFAEATAATAGHGATVWVQDYQLQLVPRMLRMLRPDVKIGFFLHIPFPPVELFMQMPWRTEIVEGILGADLVGFHLPGGAQNFLYLARRLTGHATSKGQVGTRGRHGVVTVGFRQVRVGAFPISIDSADIDAKSRSKATRDRAKAIRADLGNPKTILLGVDRLDYTKGIDVRLKAFGELLADGKISPDDCVFVQLATPSRERVESYRQMRDDIELGVGRINGEHGTVGHPVIHYLHRGIPRDELLAFFVAANVMIVTPLRDGMNLVAKEYIACRSDLGGALVLSEFTGAAAELRQAYVCNPHDIDSVKTALLDAIEQDRTDGRHRMRAMRRQVLTFTVDRWARSFLSTLAEEPQHLTPTGNRTFETEPS